ncbi:MAG TPA: hypothetical protein VGH28_13780 [Polyangiaceae bacterium]
MGCSGAAGDPLDDGGSADGADDHKLGVALDSGVDADPATDASSCPYPVADPNVLHSQCEPVIDDKCAAACGRAHHYSCEPNNTPPVALDCLSVGNSDYCCTQSACVPDVGNPATNCAAGNCVDGPYPNEIACPPGMAPQTGCSPSPIGDAGVWLYCVK